MAKLFIKVSLAPKTKSKTQVKYCTSTRSQFWKKNSNQGIFFRSSLLLQSVSTTLQTLSVFLSSIPNFSLLGFRFSLFLPHQWLPHLLPSLLLAPHALLSSVNCRFFTHSHPLLLSFFMNFEWRKLLKFELVI